MASSSLKASKTIREPLWESIKGAPQLQPDLRIRIRLLSSQAATENRNSWSTPRKSSSFHYSSKYFCHLMGQSDRGDRRWCRGCHEGKGVDYNVLAATYMGELRYVITTSLPLFLLMILLSFTLSLVTFFLQMSLHRPHQTHVRLHKSSCCLHPPFSPRIIGGVDLSHYRQCQG
jgi:hypothetical protein